LQSEIIAEDIAESVERLHQRISQLEEMLVARDRFLSIAAHELRNPMAPLVLQVGLLLKAARKGDMGPVVNGLELLEAIVERYVKRANVLLDVSRLAGDRVSLEPSPIDLAELVREIAGTFRLAAEHAGSTLRINAPDRLPAFIDLMAVEQILENLISNAIKFGAGKPVTVDMVPMSGLVRISVRDLGIGISPMDHARIFAPFEKVMARAHGGGFGVGLWVVKRLVEEMGGSIELDSTPGNGAMFAVTLPLNTKRDEE
jgi:signal transduction histidine kinase